MLEPQSMDISATVARGDNNSATNVERIQVLKNGRLEQLRAEKRDNLWCTY